MKIPNTYLFIATFADGTQIFQDEQDVSSIDPQKSQFYDVLQKCESSPLVSFVIRGEHLFGVDLRDGHFEVNRLPFFQHRPDLKEEAYADFRPIYFRTTKINIDTGTQKPVAGWVGGYTIGWQTTFNGSNVKKTFSVYFD